MIKQMLKILILSICFYIKANAQNLVPNYSFEDTLGCPTGGGQINLASPWNSPTLGTPDYFNSCASITTACSVPLNAWGYQFARTGNAYAEIMVYASGFSNREYIQVQLTDTLIQNKLYCVEFYVSNSGISSYSSHTPIAITEIGMLFSNNQIAISNNWLPLPYTPQIVSQSGVFLTDTVNWMKISGVYTALGGERYIAIGNFKNDLGTDTITVANPGFIPLGYYYIDDVSVMDCNDTSTSVQENENDYNFTLYPNPSTGNFSIKYDLKQSNDDAIFKLYDIRGKLLNETILKNENTSFDFSDVLANGVYFYQLKINDIEVKSDKLVIIK